MLQITIPARQLWDEVNEIFLNSNEQSLTLEHSLISLSKWESKYHKPFLSKIQKTSEEDRYYVKCMTTNKNIDPQTYNLIDEKVMEEINKYIEDPMTATTFPKGNNKPGSEIITAELMYFWMINYSIPFECEKWHLNRLLTLINICSIKNQPKKKMSSSELMAKQRTLNEQRLKEFNTTG